MSVCAKFTGDISADADYQSLKSYSGTIDGNNHMITLNGYSLIENASGNITIKNLMLAGTVIGENNAAAFIGYTDADTTDTISIENCVNLASVKAVNDNSAGFVGLINGGDTLNLSNSYNYGSVVSMGGNADPLANTNTNATADYKNCYYLKDGTKANGTVKNPNTATEKTLAGFESGEVAYDLNKGALDIIFGQQLGTDDADKYPVLTSGKNVVYCIASNYTNDGALALIDNDKARIFSSTNAVAMIAQYNGDILVSAVPVNISSNTMFDISITKADTADKYKVFVWNSTSELKPVSEPTDYTVTK